MAAWACTAQHAAPVRHHGESGSIQATSCWHPFSPSPVVAYIAQSDGNAALTFCGINMSIPCQGHAIKEGLRMGSCMLSTTGYPILPADMHLFTRVHNDDAASEQRACHSFLSLAAHGSIGQHCNNIRLPALDGHAALGDLPA